MPSLVNPCTPLGSLSLNLRTFGRSVHYPGMDDISDHDLERYHLGMVKDEAELASIEEHLLWCR